MPALAACGGTTAPTQGQPFHPGQPGPSNEPPTYLSATAGSSLYVVAARASTGTVAAFGPALPADGSLYDVNQLNVSADDSRVALVLRAKVGTPDWTSAPDTLVVGDGQTWTTVLQAPSYSLSFQASKDLGLFAVPLPCNGSSTATRSVIVRADGTHVFDQPDCSAQGEGFVYAFAPDDSYFVYQDHTTALTLYAAQPGATGVPVSPGGIVGSAFETSLIVFDTQGADPSLGRWIDTSGAPLTVAGYAPYTGTPAGLLDIGGQLFALADRSVKAVQAMPPGAQPEEIAGLVGDGLVVLEASAATSARLVDATGNLVGSYAPPAPITSPAPAGLQIIPVSGARSLTKAGAWILFQSVYGTPPPQGDGFQSVELSDELWLLTDADGKPAARTVSIRHIATDQYVAAGRTYVPSGDGKSAFYVEGATVHAIDVASGADQAIASSFQAGTLARRCDAGCVVF